MICGKCFREIRGKTVCPYCGFDTVAAEEKFPVALRAGSILNGRYIVGRVLGQGGFGITYLAQDDKTKTLVAIKEYMPTEFSGRNTGACAVNVFSGDRRENFEFGKQKFLEEAKTLSAFIGNEHIVRIHNYFEENGTAYFTMEYVDGQPLDKYMASHGGRLSVDEANALLLPLMEALEEVHAKGIVHRDIAPDNIIVQPDGTAKLIDFGAARYSTGEKSKSLDVVIKHGFAPYEQYLRRGRQGPFTDVYAMAATYYYAITGRVPPESIGRLQEDLLVPPSNLGVVISEKAEDALFKALEIVAKDRFQTMGEFREAMRDPEAERRAREAAERRKAEEAEKARLEEEQRCAEAERQAREEEERRAAEAAEKARREEERLRAEAEKKAREEARLAAKAAEKERRERERAERKASAGTEKRGLPKWLFAAIPLLLLAIILPIALKGSKEAKAPDTAAVAQNVSETVDAAVTETVDSYAPATFEETIVFGRYEQDNDLTNGSKPIEWLVLDKQDDRALVISRYALDCRRYNEELHSVTWETCTLRGWLNGSFLNEAFSEEELALIRTMTVSADKNPQYSTDPGNSTSDRVFLLSIDEVNRYFAYDAARGCEPTPYAVAQGCYVNNGYCWWWLRSPGDNRSDAAGIDCDGAVSYYGNVIDIDKYAVRPAMWIDVSALTQAVEQPEPEKTATVTLSSATVGDYVVFGSYEQDNDLSNGKEPIEWLVLDRQDDRILVISRNGLDCQRYNESYEDITWEKCTLRSWLNDSFLNEAFSEDEQTLIPTATVSADKNPQYDTSPGENTQDKAFLLSISEANKYFSNNTERQCEPTAYAVAQGVYNNFGGFCWWWLRSPGCVQVSAADVGSVGSVNFGGDRVNFDKSAVRPALWIDVSSLTQAAEQPEPEKTATVPLASATVGDYVVFGSYEQDNDRSNGEEPIEWLVLDKEESRLLVISRYALDSQPYNSAAGVITWEKCSLRKWLNGTFLDKAFQLKSEKAMIPTVKVTADKNPEYDTNPGRQTNDQVFLLSVSEVEEYFASDAARGCALTAYAAAQGAYGNTENNCWWWLRTPGYAEVHAVTVGMDAYGSGAINLRGYMTTNDVVAVRPALWIELGS